VPVGANAAAAPKLTTMFEYYGGDGPVGVTSSGHFYLTAKEKLENISHELVGEVRVTAISPDGKRVCLAAPQPKRSSMWDYQSIGMPFGIKHRCTETAFDERVTRICTQQTLRHRFNAIGVDSSGDLALRSTKGHIVSFQLSLETPAIIGRRHGVSLQRPIAFVPVEGDFGYKLSVARWPDGDACYLDSRGLLHLVPANRSHRELTLVLCEGELTGWRSDGRKWGKAYFIDVEARAANEHSAAAAARDAYEPIVRSFVHSFHA